MLPEWPGQASPPWLEKLCPGGFTRWLPEPGGLPRAGGEGRRGKARPCTGPSQPTGDKQAEAGPAALRGSGSSRAGSSGQGLEVGPEAHRRPDTPQKDAPEPGQPEQGEPRQEMEGPGRRSQRAESGLHAVLHQPQGREERKGPSVSGRHAEWQGEAAVRPSGPALVASCRVHWAELGWKPLWGLWW